MTVGTAAKTTYTHYFYKLNQLLKNKLPFTRPVVIVDLDRLDDNIECLNNLVKGDKTLRIVAKSLPSPELLDYIMRRCDTRALMVFEQPALSHLVNCFDNLDILLGKPLPVKAADFFLTHTEQTNHKIQWLIDTPARATQYLALAKKHQQPLCLNIELDIGLHRGGVTTLEELDDILTLISLHSHLLTFSGLMGYDAHLTLVPKLLISRAKNYQRSQAVYQKMIAHVKQCHPQLWCDNLTLNGAGSATIAMHQHKSVANDISAGSCLVKPTAFDLDTLAPFKAATFIATPVLKKIAGTHISGIEKISRLLQWFIPQYHESYFIHGGKWLANYEAPLGLSNNKLYGENSNQSLVNARENTGLHIDDFIFLRPTQSEFVMLNFGEIIAVRDGFAPELWSLLKQK